jgi:hypothetical protein
VAAPSPTPSAASSPVWHFLTGALAVGTGVLLAFGGFAALGTVAITGGLIYLGVTVPLSSGVKL